MTDAILQLFVRIDRALARIEDATGYRDSAQSHLGAQQFRARAQTALTELDAIIADMDDKR